jgi:hypothetical protein
MSSAGPTVVVVGACYYLPPDVFVARTVDFLRRCGFSSNDCERRFVWMKPGLLPTHTGVLWLRQQGEFLDVSAYDIASTEVEGTHRLYLFINDTTFDRHPWQLMAAQLRQIVDSVATADFPAMAGEVNPTTDLLLFDTANPSRRHLSTYCFAMNRKAFDIFRSVLAALPQPGSEALTDTVRKWVAAMVERVGPLGPLLHVHLASAGTPWSWKQLPLHASQTDLVSRKTVTVVFEYLLTIELLRRGGAVLPVNTSLKYRLLARWTARRIRT